MTDQIDQRLDKFYGVGWRIFIRSKFEHFVFIKDNEHVFDRACQWCEETIGKEADIYFNEIRNCWNYNEGSEWEWDFHSDDELVFAFNNLLTAIEFKLRFG